jgi:pimeloyl-ACP methyl ester carboxylesterase
MAVRTVTMSRRDFLTNSAASTVALASFSIPAKSATDDALTPFSFGASDAALMDLKRRLEQTRWPERETGIGWEQGPPLAKVRQLVEYWRGGYSWRKCDAELSQWPQFATRLNGLAVHFIHVRSQHQNALPIILTHGWPSTILLFRRVIAPLTDPTAHGGTAEDAFDVVIPSLPGFAFSEKPTERGWNAERIGRAWGLLMQRLGYRSYVAQGGDWGAFVTTAMAQQHAPGLDAIHLNFAQTVPDRIPPKLLPDQKRAVEGLKSFREKSSAYFQIQATRPQMIGYSLADSPVGQAAWLYDIFNGGTGNTGNPENVLSRDDLLDEITLYWLTDTAASSARLYLEQAQLLGKHNNPGRVDLPVAVSVFPHDLLPARSWAPQVYPRLFYWRELNRGGHFASLEVPELFTNELRCCFRSFRAGGIQGKEIR